LYQKKSQNETITCACNLLIVQVLLCLWSSSELFFWCFSWNNLNMFVSNCNYMTYVYGIIGG